MEIYRRRAKIEAVEQRNGRNRKWRVASLGTTTALISPGGQYREGELLNRNNFRGKVNIPSNLAVTEYVS